jgi:hypothetical protein
MDVYVLHHVHEIEPDHEDAKLIGVYSTEDEARKAIERLKGQPGFCDSPEGFQIDRYALDQDNWTEGYITMYPGD